MGGDSQTRYFGSLVGRVNRHRLIAVFVCTPLALALLYALGRGPIEARDILQTTLFAVGAYSSGAAAVSAWPSQRKQQLAGVPPSTAQVWLYRALGFLCGLLCVLALLGVALSIYNA
jgi:hypothetical protein